MTDRGLLYTAVLCRALALGLLGVVLGYHLEAKILGHLLAAGLVGTAVATVLVAWGADRWGRRLTLVVLAVVGAAGVAVVGLSGDPNVVVLAGLFGMVNGAGRDRTAIQTLEQPVLAAATTDARRTKTFAVYNVFADAGVAVGALLVFLPKIVPGLADLGRGAAQAGGLFLAAGLLLVPAFLYGRLSPAVEAGGTRTRVPLSPTTRKRLVGISALFALDSLGGGLVLTSLLAAFWKDLFGADERVVAVLFFGARILNALSHLAAAWLAGRIGLVNTMVFTHIPSSLLLATVPIAPSFAVAAALYLAREGLVEMDVPTRQSYVMAIVRPEERTTASAVTGLVRLLAWAVAAEIGGRIMADVSRIGLPLAIAAGLKIVYDVILWFSFKRVRPPEEVAAKGA